MAFGGTPVAFNVACCRSMSETHPLRALEDAESCIPFLCFPTFLSSFHHRALALAVLETTWWIPANLTDVASVMQEVGWWRVIQNSLISSNANIIFANTFRIIEAALIKGIPVVIDNPADSLL